VPETTTNAGDLGYEPNGEAIGQMKSLKLLQRIAVSLLFSLAVPLLLKHFVNIHRLCQSVASAIAPNLYLGFYDVIHGGCLPDHVYLSIHTALAFSFLFPLFGSRLFPLAVAAGILMVCSRVFTGVHAWYHIGGGIAVAGQSYAVASALLLPKRKVFMKDDESTGQDVHTSVGLLMCPMIWLFGIQPIQYLVLAGTCAGLLIIHLILTGFRLPVIDLLLARLERTWALPGETVCKFTANLVGKI
jgi:hypothetical protein